MKRPSGVLSLIACAALAAAPSRLAGEPQPLPSCGDGGSSLEWATSAETDYGFFAPGHVVAAEGVVWTGLEGDALGWFGTERGCWHGGLVDGPYGDDSVYACDPIHCPSTGCPIPCLAYHSAACTVPEASGGQEIEGLECAHYGDGVSRTITSGDLVLRRVLFRDLHDDAIEDDWGLSNTRLFDSFI